MLLEFLYFIFVQLSLLLPGYALIKYGGWFKKKPGLEISLSYVVSIVGYGLLATLSYVLKLDPWWTRGISWLAIVLAVFLVVRRRLWSDLLGRYRFVLGAMVALSFFSLLFISLPFNAVRTEVPDPQPEVGRNYNVFNVKVLNVAQTQANDNYVPYRQAQFFINRSDPAKDSFIGEWGVTFFERTPLMGAVTANYFNMLGDKPPIDYTWSTTSHDPDHTYKKFQVLAQIMNALILIPGFYLIGKLFNRKTAYISLLFLIPSAYFIYNDFFTWPKSLASFFILASWLLLLEKRSSYTLLAGVVSGVAYLTHDLAVIYIGTSVVYLLVSRRFKDCFWLIAPSFLIALPWLITANVIYHKPSSFIYYPISTNGIPQAGQNKQIIHQFLHTSPLRLLKIRINNIFYLLSPYQLLTSEGGQRLAKRLWGLELYSISGALGLGLLIPAILGVITKLRSWFTGILIFAPVLLCAVLIGWPKGLGALHFAEAVVLLLTGLSVFFLQSLKNRVWLITAYVINIAELIFFLDFSYKYAIGEWFTHLIDIVILCLMTAIVVVCGFMIYKVSSKGNQELPAVF